jgi:PLD-like domain
VDDLTVVSQSERRPGLIVSALEALSELRLTGLRIAVAYASLAGVRLLMPRLKLRAGAAWAAAPKTILTSFDFGLTDPGALQHLTDDPDGYEVRVSDPSVLDRAYLRPSIAFHPKMYVFDKGATSDVLLGSPNLTDRALTLNTEVAVLQVGLHRPGVLDDAWDLMIGGSAIVDEPLLDRYRALRPRLQPPAREPGRTRPVDGLVGEDPVTESILDAVLDPRRLQVFADAVDAGLRPEEYGNLWIEAGSMTSGGSHNQLELPRAANKFFGFAFNDYGNAHQVIGLPTIIARGNLWTDRPLTWHGHNRMERLNLPTFGQGGFRYEGAAVLFRRMVDGFEIEVAEWTSPLAIAWRYASGRLDSTYRLGHATARTCGLF